MLRTGDGVHLEDMNGIKGIIDKPEQDQLKQVMAFVLGLIVAGIMFGLGMLMALSVTTS